VEGFGTLRTEIGYGGLTYAFFDAEQFGFPTLLLSKMSNDEQTTLIATGTKLWRAVRAAQFDRPVDLITVYERLPQGASFRVANFYAPATMGRTPSGTGLSAHIGVEYGLGELRAGQTIIHESILGLRFTGHWVERPSNDLADAVVIPEISARSYLMGVQQIFFEEEDPFQAGFKISA
jgi:proline racemase